MVEQYKSDDGTVWWFSGTLLIKQSSGTVEKCGGKVEE